MKHIAAGLMVLALLGGCGSGSNPFEPDPATGTDGGTGDGTADDGSTADPGTPDGGGSVPVNSSVTVPAALAGNVRSASFDPTAGTLTIEGLNLDDVPFTAVYRRAASLDRPGYTAFSVQQDPLDRHFTAYAAQSGNSGSVRAAVAGSAGPRNRSFLGADFERDGNFDPPDVTPTTGLVSYAGNYVGVTNIGDVNGPDLLPVPGSVAEELRIPQALTITGEVFMNADFADNRVEGNIVRRTLVETGQGLPSLVLIASSIGANGTFEGEVEYDVGDPRSNTTQFINVGSYGGVLGGRDSDGMAGAIVLEQFDGSGNPLGFESELEHGIFVLDQCGAAVSSPVCANVNPTAGTP